MSLISLIPIVVSVAAKLFSLLRMHIREEKSFERLVFIVIVRSNGGLLPTVKLEPIDPPTAGPTGDK